MIPWSWQRSAACSDAVDEPRPRLRVRRLERVVVALDPRPDDEVGAELAGEVDRVERSPDGLGRVGGSGDDEPALAEARVEVEPRRHAVDVVAVERVADLVEVLRRSAPAGSGTRSRRSGRRARRPRGARARRSSRSPTAAGSRPGRSGSPSARAPRCRATSSRARLVSRASPVTSREGDPVTTPNEIGVGMLGYAFMGKAHANALPQDRLHDVAAAAPPRLVSIAGRNEEAVRRGCETLRLRALDDDWEELVADPTIGLFDNLGPNDAARGADDRRRRGGEARRLREAARARRGRELRDLAPRRGDRRQAHVRVQLPLRPCRAPRARADRGGRARRDPPLPRPLPPGLGRHDARRSGASIAPRPARERSATSRRTSSTSRATSSARSTRSEASCSTFVPAARSTTRSRRRSSSRTAPSGRSRRRGSRSAAATLPVGDERDEGLARVRHGAPERAPGVPRGRRPCARLQDRARLGGGPPFWEHWWPPGHIIGWGDTFVHELHHFLAAIAGDRDVAPHGRRSRTATAPQRYATRSCARARAAGERRSRTAGRPDSGRHAH